MGGAGIVGMIVIVIGYLGLFMRDEGVGRMADGLD